MRFSIASALVLAVVWSSSAPLRAQSYLVLHLDPAEWDDPPTYLFARKPGPRPSPRFEHFKLDGHLTLIRLGAGDHHLLHVDFSKYPETYSTVSRSTRGDSRALFFKEPWKVRIHPNALHYVGPAAFAPPDLPQAYAERILDLLCTSFPD